MLSSVYSTEQTKRTNGSKQQINSLAMNSTEFKDDIQINSEK